MSDPRARYLVSQGGTLYKLSRTQLIRCLEAIRLGHRCIPYGEELGTVDYNLDAISKTQAVHILNEELMVIAHPKGTKV